MDLVRWVAQAEALVDQEDLAVSADLKAGLVVPADPAVALDLAAPVVPVVDRADPASADLAADPA